MLLLSSPRYIKVVAVLCLDVSAAEDTASAKAGLQHWTIPTMRAVQREIPFGGGRRVAFLAVLVGAAVLLVATEASPRHDD